jgi:hypothetical protein
VERIQQVPTIWKAWNVHVVRWSWKPNTRNKAREMLKLLSLNWTFWCVIFHFLKKQFFPSRETPSTSLECGLYENANVVQQFEVDDRYWRWMMLQVATYCMVSSSMSSFNGNFLMS